MGTKKTKNKPTSQTKTATSNQAGSQSKMVETYNKQQRLIKWAAIVIFILLLLLLLLAGYATDWLRGTRKDALLSGTDGTSQTAGTEGTTSGTASGATGTNTSNTTTERTTTGGNTVTNNTTTRETNTTTPAPTPPATPPKPLLDLGADIDLGDNLDGVLDSAISLGIDPECRTELLVIKVCDFTQGEFTITTKSLLSNNLITSITDNF